MRDHAVEALRQRAAEGDKQARAELHQLGVAPNGRQVRTMGLSVEDAGAGVLVGDRYVNPRALSNEEFTTLVRQIRAGELRRLRFRARAFIDKPNANLFRPKPGQIPTIAENAAGALYLVGHRIWHEESRVGDIVGGDVGEHEGNEALLLDVEITEPGAQEDFLRGRQDRFSIGWDSDGAECSVCGDEFEWDWWDGWTSECKHRLGRTYEREEGDEVLCEIFYTGVTLEELSAVNLPAVAGTAILTRLGRPAEADQGAKPKESIMDQNESIRLAELEAEKKARDEELKALRQEKAAQAAALAAANDLAFKTLFEGGVQAGRVKPREEEAQRILFDSMGHERYRAELEARAPEPRFDADPRGTLAGAPGVDEGKVRRTPKAEALRWARQAHQTGLLNETPTEERVNAVMDGLRF